MQNSGTVDLYQRAWARLRPAMIGIIGFSAVINVLMLTGSIYMLQVYDRVLSSGSVPTLMGLFTVVVILYGFLALYDFLRVRMLARMAIQLDQALAEPAYRAWLRSGVVGMQGKDASPEPLRNLESLRSFVGSSAMAGLFDLPFVPMFLAILFLIHPWIGLLTIAGSALVVGLTLANRSMTKGLLQKALARDAAASDFADTGRHGAEAALAMGMEPAITRKWQTLHHSALAAGQHSSDPAEGLTAFSKAFRMLLQSAILTLGAFLVLRGEITAGMIIASSILSGRAMAPVDQVVGQLRNVNKALVSHRHLAKYFKDLKDDLKPMDLPAPTGQMTLQGVTQLAPDTTVGDRKRLLTQVGFTLEAGDGLGVIGNSASGKSTLARLLVGVWPPDMGEIRLDGATRDQWDPAVLGRHIGYMPQTLTLLPGSIRDNIARFSDEATDADVMAAAKMAGVHDMILGLPDGYQTMVGGAHDATPLSGGQVQRIGLARAIFGRPAIIVLDEPNANLDSAGDEALTRAIRALREAGSTVIVMAHRPSAIAAVNKVLVLQNGAVAQFGPKAEVLAKTLEKRPAEKQRPRNRADAAPAPAPQAKPLMLKPQARVKAHPPAAAPTGTQTPASSDPRQAAQAAITQRLSQVISEKAKTNQKEAEAKKQSIAALNRLISAELEASQPEVTPQFFSRHRTGT